MGSLEGIPYVESVSDAGMMLWLNHRDLHWPGQLKVFPSRSHPGFLLRCRESTFARFQRRIPGRVQLHGWIGRALLHVPQ